MPNMADVYFGTVVLQGRLLVLGTTVEENGIVDDMLFREVNVYFSY